MIHRPSSSMVESVFMNAHRVNLERLKRVAVIGTSCSGKTTLATQLAQCMRVTHIELDALYWLPDWVPRSDEEFRGLVAEAVAPDTWVLDGNYSKARDLVWPRATALIWLNYSFPTVLSRALRRTSYRVFCRPALFSGNRETFHQAFLSKDSIIVWVLTTYHRRRREYAHFMQEYRERGTQVFVLHTPAEARRLLAQVEQATTVNQA